MRARIASAVADLVDRLQQGDEADPRDARVDVDEPGLARDQDGGEDVVGPAAHRDDVGLDDLGAVAVERVADRREGAVGAGPVRVELGRRRRQRTARLQLGGEQVRALGAAQLRVGPRVLAQAVEQLREHVVVRVGVLAHVHRGEVHAERGDRADRALEPAARDQLAAVREQRVAHADEIREQLGRAVVVPPRLVPRAAGAC